MKKHLFFDKNFSPKNFSDESFLGGLSGVGASFAELFGDESLWGEKGSPPATESPLALFSEKKTPLWDQKNETPSLPLAPLLVQNTPTETPVALGGCGNPGGVTEYICWRL